MLLPTVRGATGKDLSSGEKRRHHHLVEKHLPDAQIPEEHAYSQGGEARLKAPAMVVQRLWRIALARNAVRRVKDTQRGDSERASVNQLRMQYILGGIQLRMLMESALERSRQDPLQRVWGGLPGPRAYPGTVPVRSGASSSPGHC